MDQSINDWLTGEAWNCKPPMHQASHNREQEASTLSNPEVPPSSQERDRLVLDALIRYEWPQTLPPRLLHGYTDSKATHMLLRVVVNLILIGALVYATIALAPVKAINDDSCLAKATWFESRFFINVVVRERLSFTEAKLTDLAWDTLIGQGLRFFHAWWLYQVATHVVTYCLEKSGLTYDLLLAVLFRTDSFSSLIAAIGMTSGKNWKKCRLYGAWLTFAIGYILVFPTIWAASTGYANSSITAYNLSDKAYVPIDSENLTLCWVADDVRLSGFLEETIIIGPTFTDAYGFNESEVPGPRTPWRLPPSSHFKDIFFCKSKTQAPCGINPSQLIKSDAQTKHSIQNYFHSSNTTEPGNTSRIINSLIKLPANYTPNDVSTMNWMHLKTHTYNQEWDGLFFYDKEDFSPPRDVWTSPGFPDILIGSQFSETFPSSNEATFYLNHSWLTYPYLGPGIVPYNSTLMLKNKTLPLPAPFLTFGIGGFDCSWWNSSTGECPCYLGKPLPANWAISDQYVCISEPGYFWGFSSFILTAAVVLEATWIIGCWVARWHTTIGSNLIEHNRRNVGTVRHILDLAETINRDLGPNTSVYTDEELQGALLKCPPVGYEVESKNGLKHVGLVTISHGFRRREKIDIHFDDTYR
ncbi:hypothetical protein F4860DRAFT_522769 [Xylaria cubensis]|nr:hypothetical protein F4860DRAFT_522769 [Xylaria cubensis]